MFSKVNKVSAILIAVTIVAALLAYFVKPQAPMSELVSPKQELPNYQMHLPGDTTLANRVTKSYGIALVLVSTPFTQKNVIALDSIRSWAREKFQTEPDFLHPVALEPINERRHTFIEAFTYNLFTAPRYMLEDLAGQFLQGQIARFHDTRAYASFRQSYFDLFGWDADAAALLARYQSDKALLAEPVVLWAAFWFAALAAAAVYLIRSKRSQTYMRLQTVLYSTWFLLAFGYIARAWIENRVSVLCSAVICAAIALYLKYPFTIKVESTSGQVILKTRLLDVTQIVLAAWLSYSLFAIQVFTWTKTSAMDDPDPLTLLICCISGNFVHDPFMTKKIVARVVALVWLFVSIWAARQTLAQDQIEAEEKLASLNNPLALSRWEK
jgi:hypothetical protein